MADLRLVIVAKEPAPGRVKTRLGARIGHRLAAELAQAFLDDTLLRLRDFADRLVVCHSPTSLSKGFMDRCRDLAPRCEFVPQVEGELGVRLAAALSGPGVRLAVGGDAPDLPLACVEQALVTLQGPADVVAAPASDGGYTLLGLASGVDSAPLGGAIRWSHRSTWADTQLAMAPARVVELAPWDDVDDLDDLRALCARLQPGVCPATEAWTRANGYLDSV